MRKTVDLSNVVVLLDGIQNNHEIELSVEGSQRTKRLLRIAPQLVFPLKRNSRFLWGLYFFDDDGSEKLWVAVVAYGDFAAGVNSETIRKAEVGVVIIHNHFGDVGMVKGKIQDYFQTLNPKQECVVLVLFGQEELFKKAKSIQKSPIWEIVCDRIMKWFIQVEIYRKSRDLS